VFAGSGNEIVSVDFTLASCHLLTKLKSVALMSFVVGKFEFPSLETI
jgi:hypothetical protein